MLICSPNITGCNKSSSFAVCDKSVNVNNYVLVDLWASYILLASRGSCTWVIVLYIHNT